MAQYTAEQRRRINLLTNNPAFRALDPVTQRDRLMNIGASEADATATVNDLQADRAAQQGTSLMASPVPPSERSLLSRVMQSAVDVGAEAAPSMIGGQIARVGGAFVPGLRLLPPTAREATGSMIGEALRQTVSDEPLSLEQIGMAGMVGGASGGLARRVSAADVGIAPETTRRLVSRLPGSTEAFMQQGTEETLERIARMQQRTEVITPPGETTSRLFQQARRRPQPAVSMERTQALLSGIADDIDEAAGLGFGNKKFTKIVKNLQNVGETSTPRQLDIIRRGLNDLLGSAARRKPELRGQIRRVLAGVFQDIDNAAAANVPEAVALQQGLQVVRREKATDALIDYLDSPRVLSPPAPGETTNFLRLNRVLDDLRRARTGRNTPRDLELLRVGLTEAELDDLIDTVEFWNEFTGARTAPRGTNVGSGQVLGTALLVGSIAGPEAGAALGGARLILSRTLSSPQGRAALRELIQRGVPVNLADLGAQLIGQSARQFVTPAGISQQLLQRFQPPQISAPR